MEIFILGLLLIIGIILILIEILFIPGTTVFGILGIIAIFSSDYLSFTYFGSLKASICIANNPAFIAPSIATVATGIPLGI